MARFDARTGLTRLVTQRISQASMTQRAGRAGRLAPGICLHLLAKEQAEAGGGAKRSGNLTQRPFRFC
ncbi:ATP-dependent helicase HrpB [Salmonella enterica subsp. enterica]|uniref:ATP-dependent helicase HrpB n=1 Tax=Salmonella enterica I TaxID=59201 RepID=A0A3S4HIV0_SALET|nr:ATP-dependent helicase HrpB [Salmonella enterica subsp. enterica]